MVKSNNGKYSILKRISNQAMKRIIKRLLLKKTNLKSYLVYDSNYKTLQERKNYGNSEKVSVCTRKVMRNKNRTQEF